MKKLLTTLLLLVILGTFYVEYFVIEFEMINKTSYTLHLVKGEYSTQNSELTLDEVYNDVSMTIEPYAKQSYLISTFAQSADYPVGIYISWNTRIYDNNGDTVSVLSSKGNSFRFSAKGFCNYAITIYEDRVEANGVSKYFCYKRILGRVEHTLMSPD